MAKAVVIVTGALILALGLSEGLLRLVASPPLYQRFAADLERTEIQVTGAPEGGWMGGLYQATTVGRRLRPRVDGLVREHHLSGQDIALRTNRLGFRGAEWDPLQRPLILFLGDALTLADYLPEEQTFVAQVERLAREEALEWQTQNAGLGAVGVQTELSVLKEVAPRIRPDAVVLNLYLDDIQSPAVGKLLPIPSLLRWSWVAQFGYQMLSHLSFLSENEEEISIADEQWDSWRAQARRTVQSRVAAEHRDEVEHLVVENFREWGAAWSPSALRRVYEGVLQIRDESHRYGAPLFVVIHPVRFQVEFKGRADWPQEKLAYWLKTDRIPFLDLLPRMRSAHAHLPDPLFYDQCRHRPEAADIVSMEIFHFLHSYGIRRSYYSVTSE